MRTLTLALCFAAAVTAADDPAGWTKARWGMTETELAEAFGPEIVHLDPPERISGVPVHLAVDVDLAGTPFRAILAPDKDGKLYNVVLSPRQEKDRSPYTFQSIENLLVQKYGHPWKTAANHTTELQWSFPSTVIVLSITEMKQLDFCLLTLQYKHKTEDKI